LTLDAFLGRRLSALLTGAGLVDVGMDANSHIWRAGDAFQTLLLQFVAIARDRIIAAGLLSADRLDRLTAELEEHLARPETLVIHALVFHAWGRKPDR
jgi:hypothetical protein